MKSRSAHCDLELADVVRQVPLRSAAGGEVEVDADMVEEKLEEEARRRRGEEEEKEDEEEDEDVHPTRRSDKI